MAGFFSVLHRLGDRSGRSIPDWASTHPDPEDREATIRRLASLAEPAGERLVRENEYKGRLEGLVYGDDPREGFVEGSRFLHPTLKFQLDFPDGWRIENTCQAVFAASSDGAAALQLTATTVPAGTSPGDYALSFFRTNQIEYGTGERIRVGSFRAFRAPFRMSSSSGVLVGEAGFVVDGTLMYEILGFTRQEGYRRYRPVFLDVIGSFHRLRDRRALEIQPIRIRLSRIDAAMSLRAALERAGMSQDAFEELALLNNALLSDELPAGTIVKVIRRDSGS